MSSRDWPVEVDPVFACWLWQGATDRRDGRALLWGGRQPISAIRRVWEAEVGPLPLDLEIDHLCRRPTCVAPHHAELVNREENERRKSWRRRSRRTHCAAGHELALHAAVTEAGGRVCRACNRLAIERDQ